KKEKVDGNYDALILAGGEVIHLFDERTWVPIYNKNKLQIESKNPSDVVWDWIDAKSKFKAWISVGVRPFEDKWDEKKINGVIRGLDYLSVRGILSKKILESGNLNEYLHMIQMSPDLGWLFPKYLEYRKLTGDLYRKHISAGVKYAIFQVNAITEEEAGIIAAQLLSFQDKYNIKIYLLPVIHP